MSETMTTDATASGVDLIAAERRRQVESEGWTAEHDDQHGGGEMTDAAVAYARAAGQLMAGQSPERAVSVLRMLFPWPRSRWTPSPDPIRNLVKAGALIAAEIDRLQRAKTRA